MNRSNILVLDCGATNLRAVAIDAAGHILAIHSIPNNTQPDPHYPSGLIWDADEIWRKLVECTRSVAQQIAPKTFNAITVTTFGVNGAPIDSSGNLLYPVISWQCQRTAPIMDGIDKYIDPVKLYEISGVNRYSFNTINTLIWLKENRPEVIEGMYCFLFMPSIFIHKLTGSKANDTTMAGTSMLTDLTTRGFSDHIIGAIGIPNRFGELTEPGSIAGNLTQKAAQTLNIQEGIPVVVAGHDTQFSMIGSGAKENEVVLSSGTWEILMARVRKLTLSKNNMMQGVTNEFDAVPGLYNSGIQWLASGALEWIRRTLYQNEKKADKGDVYRIMIEEASAIEGTSVRVSPELNASLGSIQGISLHTCRGEIYRAALEGLSCKAKESLAILEAIGGFKAQSLIIGGGGTRNKLWNQLRANALGIPLKLHKEMETTVIGAALFAQVAIGEYGSIEEAMGVTNPKYDTVYPE